MAMCDFGALKASSQKSTKLAKTFARYRGHLGPPGPKLENESENEFPGPLGPGAQNVENRVEKESKSTVFQLFCLFSDSVCDFWGPGAERPPGTHSNSFSNCGLGGPK